MNNNDLKCSYCERIFEFGMIQQYDKYMAHIEVHLVQLKEERDSLRQILTGVSQMQQLYNMFNENLKKALEIIDQNDALKKGNKSMSRQLGEAQMENLKLSKEVAKWQTEWHKLHNQIENELDNQISEDDKDESNNRS